MRIRGYQCMEVILILLVLLAAADSFAAQHEKQGGTGQPCRILPPPLQGHHWWRHYERGVAYMQGECWREAAEDFQAAIAQRQEDDARARTQGLNIIAYFPHRELGVAYYHLGRYPEAAQELELSLDQAPQRNARAEHYLRLAQQALQDSPSASGRPMPSCDVSPDPLQGRDWWHYYRRGAAYIDGKCWNEAAQDFKAAIGQRYKDKAQARTYGLHFIDYFPHRELGVAYYHLGRYVEAIEELETSLKHVKRKNDRAKHYLDLARNAI